MTPIAFLRQMLAVGMDMETAMAAADAFALNAEAEHERLLTDLLNRLSVDQKAEARRAKDRARKAKTKHGIPRNSAESAENVELKKVPEPLKNKTPSPPLKGGISPKISASPPEKPKTLTDWVSEIWEITSKPGRERSGRAALETSLKAADRAGHDLAAIKAGVAGYYASDDATKAAGQYAQGVHVVVKSGRWESFAASEPAAPAADADPWPRRMRGWRVSTYWNSEWGPKPGRDGCLVPPSYLREPDNPKPAERAA